MHGASVRTRGQRLIRSVLRWALYRHGLDWTDFEIQASAAPMSRLGLNDSLLMLRCKSTGQERFYTDSADSSWLESLIDDLDHGAFGAPLATPDLLDSTGPKDLKGTRH